MLTVLTSSSYDGLSVISLLVVVSSFDSESPFSSSLVFDFLPILLSTKERAHALPRSQKDLKEVWALKSCVVLCCVTLLLSFVVL